MERKKKKSIYKKLPKSKKGHRLKGGDNPEERFTPEYTGEDPRAEDHPGTDDVDYEAGPEPNDKASKHKYPPPRKHPIFREYWISYIDNIVSRENFTRAHLSQLEMLCDLHVEYEQLSKFVREKGRRYKSYGRNGMQWKFYPEVVQRNKVQSQMKEYMKLCGLLLKKDQGDGSGEEKEQWD
jgi:hypothetical protein